MSLSGTRESARADATAYLSKGYKNIQDVQDENADNQQTAATRHEADSSSGNGFPGNSVPLSFLEHHSFQL